MGLIIILQLIFAHAKAASICCNVTRLNTAVIALHIKQHTLSQLTGCCRRYSASHLVDYHGGFAFARWRDLGFAFENFWTVASLEIFLPTTTEHLRYSAWWSHRSYDELQKQQQIVVTNWSIAHIKKLYALPAERTSTVLYTHSTV